MKTILSILFCVSVVALSSCGTSTRAGYSRSRDIIQHDTTYIFLSGDVSRISTRKFVSSTKTMKNFRGEAPAARDIACPFEQFN